MHWFSKLSLPLAAVFVGCQTLPQSGPADAPRNAAVTPARQPAAHSAAFAPRPPAPIQHYPVIPAGHHAHARHAAHAPTCPCCGPGTLPAFAFTGHGHGHDESLGPWKPDGIKGPWPRDEYVCDGGDLNHDVYVKQDWTVVGLDQQDTVAHFDTRDGQTLVAASNCVCIYSPRFAAVRQVSAPVIYEAHERMADVVKPARVNIHEEMRGPRTASQPEQLIAQVGLDQVQRFREQNAGLLVDQVTHLNLAAHAFLPHEELAIIRLGQFEASETALLHQRAAAAETWTIRQAVQVLIGGQPAVEARGLSAPNMTYTYETGGKPCLRLCKIADKSEAKPGEIVTFTLRFDNLGEQKIGNVTIIDHLLPRLEYVPGSAQSTLKASFRVDEQPGESLVLRWEIEEPLDVTQGGILRFKARVR